MPIHPGTNALEIVPVYLARSSTPSHLSPSVSFDYDKSNGWNVAAFTIYYPGSTRSMGKTFRSYKIHRILKLCRIADRGAGFETFARDATTQGRERKFIATRSTLSFRDARIEILIELHPPLGMSSCLTVKNTYERRTKVSHIEWFNSNFVSLFF